MRKKHSVPKIYKKERHDIPLCSECGEEMVIFHKKWTCKGCMKIKIQAFPGWEPEEIAFGALYTNRAQRRHGR